MTREMLAGRLVVSDVVDTAPLSEKLRADPVALCCFGGAAPAAQVETWLAKAGFVE